MASERGKERKKKLRGRQNLNPLFSSSSSINKKLLQVDDDALRVGLSDGSLELREVLLDAEALDEMLVRVSFRSKTRVKEGKKEKENSPSTPSPPRTKNY